MGRGGAGIRVTGLGLELVSKAVFMGLFLEISLFTTLEPHVGHAKISNVSILYPR